MLNTLTTFEKLMQDHEVIRANLRQIAGIVDNLSTISSLQDGSGELTYHQISYLSDKRVNLKRAISSLREGLIVHHQREEEAIQYLVGTSLLGAIKKEHQSIVEQAAEIDWMLLNISPAGILFNSVFLKQKVDNLCQTLEAICLRENSILELLIKIPVN
jgi:hypothetical protein